MKVLVTGASGRVGANMVRRLLVAGADVKAMVMPGDAQAAKLHVFPDVEVVEADLLDQESICSACEGVTHVIHLAAQLERGDTPVDKLYNVNALGTLRLLEGVVRSGVDLARFVLASSDGTYRPGNPPNVPLTEESPQDPADYYGTSKLLSEIILRNHSIQFQIPFSIVRFATVVSPEESSKVFRKRFWRMVLGWQRMGRDSHLWPLFEGQSDLLEMYESSIQDMPDDTAVGLTGPDGSPWTLSMVDVRDAVRGVFCALTEAGALGQSFNIAAAEPTSHAEGVSVVSDAFGVPARMVEMPLNYRLELSTCAAEKLISYRPRYDYKSMVRDGMNWQESADCDFIPANAKSGVAST